MSRSISKLIPVILLGLSFSAFASVPLKNEDLVRAGDGNLYSAFPAGNVTPPPPYVALDINLGAALANAGWGAIPCGTTGTDISTDVRTGYITGTNAATGVITIVNPTGDNVTTEGATAPGSGSNLTFECANPTLSKSGSFQLSVTDGTSTDVTTVKTWASVGTGVPPPPTRNLIVEMDFETGAITDRDTTTNGVYKDSALLGQLIPRATFTVSNVSKANPGVLTWTGADPTFTNPDSGTNGGFTFPTISSGMTQLSNCLVRLTGINNTTNTGNMVVDGTNCSTSDGNHTLGDHNLNTSSFSVWSGTQTVTLWDWDSDNAPGSLPPASTKDVHVVATKTPPSNLVGSAAVMNPRSGGFFLSTQISKDHDYSAESGQSGKNKMRWTTLFDADGPLDIANNEVSCVAVSIALPSNYDHNDRGGVNQTENQILRMAESAAQDEAAWTLSVTGDTSLTDHFNFTVDDGLHLPVSHQIDNDLGSVANSIGKWTDFIVYFKLDDNDGFVEVWRRYADNTSSVNKNETAWQEVFSRGPGVGVGHTYANKFRLGLRNYKYGWIANTLTTPSWDLWYGIDELRMTRFASEGGDCGDVTVDGSDPTSGASADVEVYPVPTGHTSARYTVALQQGVAASQDSPVLWVVNNWGEANNADLTAENHWTQFSSGSWPVNVTAAATVADITSAVVRPARYAITPTVSAPNDTISFSIPGPGKYAVFPNGMDEYPLFIFASAIDTNVPTINGTTIKACSASLNWTGVNTCVFEPGVYDLDSAYPQASNCNTTVNTGCVRSPWYVPYGKEVYIKGGAWVDGQIELVCATGTGVFKIRGRGTLTGEQYRPNKEDQAYRMIHDDGNCATGSQVYDGITIALTPRQAIVAFDDASTYNDMKFMSFTGDAIRLNTGSSVTNSFFKVNDDSIKPYASNVTATDNVIWLQKTGVGVVFSWNGSSDITNVLVDGIDMIAADRATVSAVPGVYTQCISNSLIGIQNMNGGHIHGNTVQNVRIDVAPWMIFQFHNKGCLAGFIDGTGTEISDFTLKNISSPTPEQPSYFNGNGTSPGTIHDFHFQNVEIGGADLTNADMSSNPAVLKKLMFCTNVGEACTDSSATFDFTP